MLFRFLAFAALFWPALPAMLAAADQAPVVFSPNNETKIVFSDKETLVFNVNSGERIATIPRLAGNNEDAQPSAIFAADGTQCFILDGRGTVTRYDTKDWKANGKTLVHPAGDAAYEFFFDVSDDGKWVVTYDSPGENGPKGNLQVWDAQAGKPLGKPIVSVNGSTGRFISNNRVLIVPCRADATVRDLPSMKIAYTLRPHEDTINGPKTDLSPDRKWLLTWGDDHRLDLYDAANGKLATYNQGPAVIKNVLMAPDSSGCYVVFDNTAFFLQNHHDYYVAKIGFPKMDTLGALRITEYLLDAFLSPDGKLLSVRQGEGEQERLLVYDAATLKPIE